VKAMLAVVDDRAQAANACWILKIALVRALAALGLVPAPCHGIRFLKPERSKKYDLAKLGEEAVRAGDTSQPLSSRRLTDEVAKDQTRRRRALSIGAPATRI